MPASNVCSPSATWNWMSLKSSWQKSSRYCRAPRRGGLLYRTRAFPTTGLSDHRRVPFDPALPTAPRSQCGYERAFALYRRAASSLWLSARVGAVAPPGTTPTRHAGASALEALGAASAASCASQAQAAKRAEDVAHPGTVSWSRLDL